MSNKSKNVKWPRSLSIPQRVAIARERTEKLIGHVQYVIALHESNALLNYSGLIADQVKPSHAAHTFSLLQDSQYGYELIRLCALWDPVGEDRESIPTIVALVSDENVRRDFAKEIEVSWLEKISSVSDDVPELVCEKVNQKLQQGNRDRAKLEARATFSGLEKIEKLSNRIAKCDRLKALRDMRDKNLAHNLDPNVPDKSAAKLKYGDESWLLKLSIRVADRLYPYICGIDFDLEESREIARMQAKKFWKSVSIKVLD